MLIQPRPRPFGCNLVGQAAYLELYTPPFSMLRGGSVPSAHVQQAHLQQLKRNYTYRVVTASLPAWIETSFTEQDYVVLKLDIEGAEHSILAEMMARGLMRLVDVLTLECHAPQSEPAAKGSTCAALLARLAHANPRMQLNPLGADGKQLDSVWLPVHSLPIPCARSLTLSRPRAIDTLHEQSAQTLTPVLRARSPSPPKLRLAMPRPQPAQPHLAAQRQSMGPWRRLQPRQQARASQALRAVSGSTRARHARPKTPRDRRRLQPTPLSIWPRCSVHQEEEEDRRVVVTTATNGLRHGTGGTSTNGPPPHLASPSIASRARSRRRCPRSRASLHPPPRCWRWAVEMGTQCLRQLHCSPRGAAQPSQLPQHRMPLPTLSSGPAPVSSPTA